MAKFYKITNDDETHFGFKYVDGLNKFDLHLCTPSFNILRAFLI